jgi:tetratricopeptide (TPR) repeat protein
MLWKVICGGCVDSFHKSGNARNCPFCKAKTVISDHKRVEQMKKRVEANDTGTMVVLANQYLNGQLGLQQDWAKTVELLTRASELGSGRANFCLGGIYEGRGDLKKAKFHLEAAAMAGHELARFNIGLMEYNLGSPERAVKHWKIAASAGEYAAMHNLKGYTGFSRDEIDPILTAYNNSCAEMRSEARDAYMRRFR